MENFLFVLKKLISFTLLPPGGLILLGLLGIVMLRRWRRSGLTLACIALLSLWLLSLPVVADRLERLTRWQELPDPAALREAQAVVILGGGAYRRLLDYEGESVSGFTLERLRAGVRLARELHLPILVSGGAVWTGTPEAELMQRALVDFGSAARWQETLSRDTRDNARMSALQLQADGITRVALVTHAFHMKRAMEEFRRAGLQPIPAPTILRRSDAPRLMDFVPSAYALLRSEITLHELAGQLALSLRAAAAH
ncbi:MAG: YdcF family protein [Rhodocyclaceae bacterium]|nr:YdcF family protein [Rhodocyclaceae bacterium]